MRKHSRLKTEWYLAVPEPPHDHLLSWAIYILVKVDAVKGCSLHPGVVVRTGRRGAKQTAFALADALVSSGKIECPPGVPAADYRTALDFWLGKVLKDANKCQRCLADAARQLSERIGPPRSSGRRDRRAARVAGGWQGPRTICTPVRFRPPLRDAGKTR